MAWCPCRFIHYTEHLVGPFHLQLCPSILGDFLGLVHHDFCSLVFSNFLELLSISPGYHPGESSNFSYLFYFISLLHQFYIPLFNLPHF